MNDLTLPDIRRIVGARKFAQGKECHWQGRVREIKAFAPGIVIAEVADHRDPGEIHHVIIQFHPKDYGTPEAFRGSCSCGPGHNCRHVTAALLTLCQGQPPGGTAEAGETGEASEAEPDFLSPKLRRWLDSPPVDAAPIPVRPRSAPSQDQLFFVFFFSLQDGTFGVRISFYRGRIRKDGSMGVGVKPWHGYDRMGAPQKFLTLEDLEILAHLSFHRAGRHGERYDWPDGEDLVRLVRRIVETGRARAGSIGGPALSWTDPVAVSAAWCVDTDGDQYPGFRNAEGALVELVPFPVPLALDPASGRIGVAETGLAPGIAVWLAAAPPAPAEATEAIAARLGNIDRNLPLPEVRHAVVHADKPIPRLTLFGHTPPAGAHRALQAAVEFHLEGGRDRLHAYAPKSGSFSRPMPYPCARLDFLYPGAPEPVRSHTLWEPGEPELRKTLPDIRVSREAGFEIFRRDRDLEVHHLGHITHLVAKHCPEELMADIDVCLQDFDRGGLIDWLFPVSADPGEGGFAPALDFLAGEVPKLRASGWEVETEDSWPFRMHEGPVAFSTAIEPSGNDWFSLSLRLQVDGQSMDLVPLIIDFIDTLDDRSLEDMEDMEDMEDSADAVGRIRELLAGREFHPRLPDGTVAVIAGERLAPFIAAFLEARGLVGFHAAETGRAMALAEALDGCGAPWTAGRELEELGHRLRALAETPEMHPGGVFTGNLRPYQLAGYGWLRSLAATGFGGVLADDMGLGKTVQALALLAHRYLEEEQEKPSLLVVPTSLIGNWRREAERFAPGLKVLVLHGPDRRERFDAIPEHQLVVTTYPLVHRDHPSLFRHEYDVAILDEAQNVKNPAAATSKRIRDIRARQRIALTGTPIENSLEELWTLFDWLIPGLLGDRKSFAKNYRTPIERMGDTRR
ncbi:MAG: SNF2-related protein, partial [Gammaproteobacteria bacterium]|nr:SNF2-related protein [Gammaproteobacteria bacterium]